MRVEVEVERREKKNDRTTAGKPLPLSLVSFLFLPSLRIHPPAPASSAPKMQARACMLRASATARPLAASRPAAAPAARRTVRSEDCNVDDAEKKNSVSSSAAFFPPLFCMLAVDLCPCRGASKWLCIDLHTTHEDARMSHVTYQTKTDPIPSLIPFPILTNKSLQALAPTARPAVVVSVVAAAAAAASSSAPVVAATAVDDKGASAKAKYNRGSAHKVSLRRGN